MQPISYNMLIFQWPQLVSNIAEMCVGILKYIDQDYCESFFNVINKLNVLCILQRPNQKVILKKSKQLTTISFNYN